VYSHRPGACATQSLSALGGFFRLGFSPEGRKTEEESEFPPTSLFLLPPFETILATKLGVSRTAVREMAGRRLAEVETIP
jgi:hypothetical protein